MIKAAKNPVGHWLVWQIARSSITKQFNTVQVRRRAPQEADQLTLPTIYYVNHSNWWDGFICEALVQQSIHQDCYLFMEEKNLKRYRFFTWAGAFGVDRDDGRAALGSLAYAAATLKAQPGRGVFIFPQGTMTPNERRPLQFYSGVAHLARRIGQVRLVPIALRYEFMQEQRADAFISIGAARTVANLATPQMRTLTNDLAATLTAELDALSADIVAERLADFHTIMRGGGGIDRVFDRAMSRDRRESRRLSQEDESQ
jgi:chlorobactene lauroyltransferase